jgi:predicted metalloendopeptidase
MKNFLNSVIWLSIFIIIGLSSCAEQSEKKPSTEKKVTHKVVDKHMGINVSSMDKTIKPGDDFYNYANGSWMKNAKIPDDRSSTGSFLVAFEETEKNNKEIITSLLASKPPANSNDARIADFYSAYLDTSTIDSLGMKPIQSDLDHYTAIADKSMLSTVLGSNLRADVDPLNATNYFTENLFGLFVTQGLATPGEVLPYLLQGGLGLPQRQYYLSTDPKMLEIRTAYQSYIQNLLVTAGIKDAATKAERIFALETKIAHAHVPREDSESFVKSATVWSREDFDSKAPGIDWSNFFDAARLANQQRFAAYHASGISHISALVESEPLEDWINWLVFHQINSHSDVLPTAIDQAHFDFYGTIMRGTPQQRSRDKRSLSAVNTYLSDAVGQAYVKKYFPASAKAEVSKMVSLIVKAFSQRIKAIDWMTDSTKNEALTKVDTIIVSVGYPDKWRDYSKYDVSPDTAYANVIVGEKVEYVHQLAKIGYPMDKGEWWMSPQVVNAVNLPVQNALNFPAGILQPPFFDEKADAAYNYGAIGAVIGHEISHSFDNNGAAFDSTGAMRNWWTEEDFARFEQQGKVLAEQFDAYSPYPGLHVNGTLTLGENIADVAGLAATYDAYRASLNGKPAPVMDGLTGDQRFFIAYTQTWASKTREEAMRSRIANGSHAPGQYRALTVRNLDSWYKAFNVQSEDDLYLAPDKRVKIW